MPALHGPPPHASPHSPPPPSSPAKSDQLFTHATHPSIRSIPDPKASLPSLSWRVFAAQSVPPMVEPVHPSLLPHCSLSSNHASLKKIVWDRQKDSLPEAPPVPSDVAAPSSWGSAARRQPLNNLMFVVLGLTLLGGVGAIRLGSVKRRGTTSNKEQLFKPLHLRVIAQKQAGMARYRFTAFVVTSSPQLLLNPRMA